MRILERFKILIVRIINDKRPSNILLKLINSANERKCCSQVKIGKNSYFLPEAIVENHTRNRDKIVIGDGTRIRGELTIYPYGKSLQIGNNSYIGKWTVIRAGEKVVIGNNVLIAHSVTIIDSDSHEINYIERSNSYRKMITVGQPQTKGNIMTKPIIIEDYAWISYGCSILKGVTIGKGAIVGACSVVTKDVPPWTVVAGNPARIIKTLNQE